MTGGAVKGGVVRSVRAVLGVERGRLTPVAVACLLTLTVVASVLAPLLLSAPSEVVAVVVLIAAGAACVYDLAAFLFVLLTVATNVFGLVDLNTNKAMGLPAYDVALTGLFVLFVLSRVVRGDVPLRDRLSTPPARLLLALLVGIAGLIVYSSLKWGQTLFVSVRGAHDFVFYALALFALFVRIDADELSRCARSFVAVAGILVLVPIVGFFVDLKNVLPGVRIDYYVVAGRTFFRSVPQAYYVLYIAFFLLLYDVRLVRPALRNALLGVLGLAVAMMGFRAGWIALVGTVGWIALRDSRDNFSKSARALLQGLTIVVVVAGCIWLTGSSAYVSQRVQVVSSDLAQDGRPLGTLGSLSIRLFQIHALGAIFARQPILGAGFIFGEGPAAGVAREFGLLYVSTNDVGWIDILVRSGLVGAAFFVLATGGTLRRLRALEPSPIGGFARAMRAYLWFCVISLIGSAPFSCPAGVVPLAALLGLGIASHPSADQLAESNASAPADAAE